MRPTWCSGLRALEDYLNTNPGNKGIFLETAHPVKFYDVVEPIINKKVEIPENIRSLLLKEKSSLQINAEFELLREFLEQL